MDIVIKRIRWIILVLVIAIIGLNVFFYYSFYKQQLESRRLVLNKQVSITSSQIESAFQRFRNDLAFYFTFDDIRALFEEKSMNSKPVRKTRQFFIKYNDFIKEMTFTDFQGNQFEFNGTTDNYFQKRYLKIDRNPLRSTDTVIKKFDPTGFDVIVRVVDEGIVRANIKLAIDIQDFIRLAFEQNYVSRNTLEALCDTQGQIITANFVPELDGFSESELISRKIKLGLSEQFGTSLIKENQKINLISVVYPVKILDYPFGLVFSEDTKSIFTDVLRNSITLSLLTIILFIFIILIFIYILSFLRENELKLSQANSELEQITIISNHDLQEPLRKIQIFSNRLLQLHLKQGDERTISYLDKILGFSEKMQTLLEEVLTYSFINRQNITRQTVDLNAVMQSVKNDFDSGIKESGAVIEIGPLPLLEGNDLYLKKLFENLLSNSIKYAQPSVIPVIKIHSTVLNQRVHIYFEDNGIGIDMIFFDKIFKPFQKLGQNEGMGMGLSICKKIVEFHKGVITLRSEVNKGTIFIITLPLQQNKTFFHDFLFRKSNVIHKNDL